MTAIVLALIAGAVVGLALGALGGGGSVLAVPALIYLLGFSPSAATTASLIIVAATSATALYAHAREGHVAWKETFDTLKEVGYDGWMVVEAFGLALPEISAATKIWRRMYKSEEQLATDALKFMKNETAKRK